MVSASGFLLPGTGTSVGRAFPFIAIGSKRPCVARTGTSVVRAFPFVPDGSVTFSAPKRSWIVRTESNVRKESWKKPDPPCPDCNGSGRTGCRHCLGRGRDNYVHLAMLPKGEWPKWCKWCRGSGLSFCNRCLGSGEFRQIMGFHFLHSNED